MITAQDCEMAVASAAELTAFLAGLSATDPPTIDDGPATQAELDDLQRSLDVTDLRDDAPAEAIAGLCDLVATLEPPPAAICVWHDHLEASVRRLSACPIAVAGVVDFPHGTASRARKLREVEQRVEAGATEIDAVLDRRTIVEPMAMVDEVRGMVDAARGRPVKAILETGSLIPGEQRVAAWSALLGGAGFLKTSTGFVGQGATFEAVATLADAVGEFERATGQRRGVKVSGGVRTVEEAVQYRRLVASYLGGLSKDRFRIGASSLLEALLERRP